MTVAATVQAYPQQVTERDLQLSETARAKMAELMTEAEDMAGIRIFVSGGGCSGMAYGMTFAEAQTEYDSVLQGEGFRLLIDPVALNYLQGCVIDFLDQGPDSTFVFNNVFQSVGGSGVCGGCAGGGF